MISELFWFVFFFSCFYEPEVWSRATTLREWPNSYSLASLIEWKCTVRVFSQLAQIKELGLGYSGPKVLPQLKRDNPIEIERLLY